MGYILVGTIIGGIIWGIVVNKVIENKGYEENWFWWGFFFGIFALIIALTKQSVNTTKVVIESSAPVKENIELLSSCILNNQVNVSSPVHISSWEIKKDTEKLVLFVDFINVSCKEISAVMFSATGFNSFGDIVQVNDANFFDVIGQDLSIKSNGCGKAYTTLQDDAIRKVEIKVKKICFADGTIVDDIQDEWINTNQLELKPVHIDCVRRENTQSKYYAIIKERYWQCVCGFVNTQNTCALCGMQKNNALKFTQDNIEDTYNGYLKQIEIKKFEEEKRKLEEKQLQEKQQMRNKKIVIYTTCVIAVFVVLATILNNCIIPNIKYKKGIDLIENGDYFKAIKVFSEINDYKDVEQKIDEIWTCLVENTTISSGDNHTVAIKKDGTVIAHGASGYGQCDVLKWKDIISVSAGTYHTVGLKKDGTVVATGSNSCGQCNVEMWTDIVQISANSENTVGLKKDGTVIAIGRNGNGQCNVSSWSDIISVVISDSCTIGLKKDGTVVATGNNYNGQCNVDKWSNIIKISTNDKCTVGLKEDGTVVATGQNRSGQCDVGEWTDVVNVVSGFERTIGIKSNGCVIATGDNYHGQCNVSEWVDIVAVSTENYRTIALKKDGTIITTYGTGFENWENIKTSSN